MARPTRSQLESWKPDTWSDQGTSLDGMAESVRDAGSQTVTAAQNVEGEWTGEGQKAAETRALDDDAEISRLAGKLFDASDALTDAGRVVGEIRTSLLKKARQFEQHDFAVSEDWEVMDISPVATASESDSAADRHARRVRAEEAANGMVTLRSYADAAGEEDGRYGRKISDALNDIDMVIPPGAGLSSVQAASDAEALSAGTATAEQRRRFESATSLTNAQRQALAEGDYTVIPKGQMDYLDELADELDREGGLAAFEEFGGRNTELKAGLADGMQILSNPRVRTREELPTPSWLEAATFGEAPTQYRSGGLEALPPSWSGPLTSSPVELRSSGATPGRPGQLKSGTRLSTIDDLGTISQVLEHGGDEARMGTDIDRALIARAGDIAGATNDPDELYTSPDNLYGMEHSEIGETLNSMLEVAGQDEIAVHDALMSGRDGGPSAVSAMPETYSAPDEEPSFSDPAEFEAGAYDADSTMTNLLSFNWDEQAGHDSGMREMLGGLGDPDTVVGEAGDPGPAATRAGEASGELARIIADNRDTLVDVPFHGNDSMGQVNPGVSEAAADAVGPHLIDLAGGDASDIGIDGAQTLDGQDQMSRLFEVLNMHPDSATAINTHGADAVSYLQHEIGENAEFQSDGNVKAMDESRQVGRISIGMEEGLEAAGTEMNHDERREVAADYYRKGVQFDAATTVVSGAAGLAPGGGAFAAGADIFGTAAKDEALGAPPYTGELTSEEFDELRSEAEARVEMAQPRNSQAYANLLSGYAEQHPDIRNGELAEYFDGDGTVTVPGVGVKEDDFVDLASDAMNEVSAELALGVDKAGDDRTWR